MSNSSTANIHMNRKTKPPFGYYGSKQRIASRIVAKLPPHSAWVEAFCGSAAVTLAKNPAPIEIINDIDGQIVNLFEQIRNNCKVLCEAVALTPYARDEYHMAKNIENELTPLERARKFLVATMMTVNGANGGDNAGFSFSQSYTRQGREARVNRWYNLPERLSLVAERLRNVRVENLDARVLISRFIDRPATLIYLDPPYFMNRQQAYTHDANDESFHSELLDICCKSHSMIIVSGYDNNLYNSILKVTLGWTKELIPTTTRDTSGKDHLRTEVIWKNKYFYQAQATMELPISLSSKEIKQKKVNPQR